MKKLLKISGLVGVLLFVLTGCGAAAVYNVQNSPVEVKKGTSQDTIYKAIKQAGYKKGWRISKVKPGVAKAFINVRGKHQANALIEYNSESYSINYQSSSNLKYDETKNTIHKNYNSWIVNLDNAIQTELSMLAE